MGNTQFAVEQAGPQVRHQTDLIQAECAGALPDHHIMHQQHWCQATPAAFQATDAQGHAQGLFSLALGFIPVLGNQRHQFTPKADVQAHQHNQ
ncbi:hypothetical protein D3C80_1713320 [compost metagenome]